MTQHHRGQMRELVLAVLREATPEELYATYGIVGFAELYDLVSRRLPKTGTQ